MRQSAGLAVLLVTIWVLAWGSLTWANVLSGVLVAAALLVVVPDVRRASHPPTVRPVPAARLVVRMLRDVAASNLQLAREVLTRGSGTATGVVRVPLAGCSDEMVTIVASLVAMTPGTMPVEVEQGPTVIYVHVLHLDDPDVVRRSIWRLRDQVVQAFGTPEAIAEVARVKAESLAGEGP
jgi:multicomponent Na+:H+ antiporter subunit E